MKQCLHWFPLSFPPVKRTERWLQVDSRCSDFLSPLSILIFRICPGLMGVHLLHSMGAARSWMQNGNEDRQGRKGGKEEVQVLTVQFFATRLRHKDCLQALLIPPYHPSLPVHKQNQLLLHLVWFLFCDWGTQEDVTARKWERVESQIRRWFT